MDNMVNVDARLNGGGHFCPSCQVLATLAIPGFYPRQPGHWAGLDWQLTSSEASFRSCAPLEHISGLENIRFKDVAINIKLAEL